MQKHLFQFLPMFEKPEVIEIKVYNFGQQVRICEIILFEGTC